MDNHYKLQKQLSNADQQWLYKIEELFTLNLEDSQVTIKKLAREALISERQFYRKLKKLTGKTPFQYLHDLRLEKAKRLLETGQYDTIKGVALSVGFSRTDYFSKVYENKYGKRPATYLEEGANGSEFSNT